MRTWVHRLARHISSSALATRQRFYKDASVELSASGGSKPAYNVCLDGRLLLTPGRQTLEIPSEALAHAIANEWNMQKKTIRENSMRLTGILFTATDNPMSLKKSDLIGQVLEYLEKDTILYRFGDNEKLTDLQKEQWDPVIEWANQEFKISLEPTYSIVSGALVTEESRSQIHNHLSQFNFTQLVALHYAAESLKSMLLVIATIKCFLDVPTAVDLALLEHHFQTNVWGKIEWAHDMEREELMSRLAASTLVLKLTESNDSAQEVKKSELKE